MEELTINIGIMLSEQRKKLGYSLKDVAEHTRIRKNFLESMEKNQFGDLPGPVFVTGFLRVYARYLGLDSNALLSRLAETGINTEKPSLQNIQSISNKPRPFKKPSGSPAYAQFVISFLVVLIVGSSLYLFLSRSQVKEALVAPKLSLEAETTLKHTEALEATAEKPPDITVPLQDEAAETAAVEVLAPQLRVLPPVPLGGGPLRMLALQESSLTVYIDERKPLNYKLYDGLDLTWDIKANVKVEIPEPGVARFWLGGQELSLNEITSFQLQPETGSQLDKQ